jgi:DnaJ-class molecular chaperone
VVNYYKILGLETYASVSVAKSAYKKLIKIYHPDISDSPNAEEMTRLLNRAKDHVGTALAKEKYDRKLKLAYLREIQRLSGLRTTPTPAAVRPTKTDLQEKNSQTKPQAKSKIQL